LKTESIDGQIERKILIGMITHTGFLQKVFPKYHRNMFPSKIGGLISSWCVNYYKKYKKAPNKQIESIYLIWTESDQDKASHTAIEKFLGSLSKEYDRSETIDLTYLLDIAARWFNDIAADLLQISIVKARQRGDVEEAVKLATSFREINFKTNDGIDIISDISAHEHSFNCQQKTLVSYKGGLGDFFGNTLSEDSFVAFFGVMKGGKSYWLLDIAMRAIFQKRKVAYFQVGDLSQDQIIRRFQARFLKRPIQAKNVNYPIILTQGKGIDQPANVEFEIKRFLTTLNFSDIQNTLRKLKAKTNRFRLSCHPLGTVSILDIRNILETWDQTDWRADICIIDYADNLSPVSSKETKIEQVAETWGLMRQLSQMRKCLVVTVSQPKQEAFRSWVMTRQHVSDSKMKLAHVSAFIGINQTSEEKERQIQRLNYIVSRENDFSETKCCYVAGCLDIANPAILSNF